MKDSEYVRKQAELFAAWQKKEQEQIKNQESNQNFLKFIIFAIAFIITQSLLLVCSYSEIQSYNRSLTFNIFDKETMIKCRSMPQVKLFWAEFFILYAPLKATSIV